MSLHTRCRQRIASTCAHGTAWRRRGARYYASDAANGPEWFQRVRTELLSRQPQYQREYLDPLHYEQLSTTLEGFVPRLNKLDTETRPIIPLFELLTRFNVRVQSSKLLPDGTDPLHSPGEPWMRRMWAGGAVKFNPGRKLRSETPFRLHSRVACVERIKDVRLQGTGDDAKVFVTIERRFTSVDQRRDVAGSQSKDNVRAHISQQVDRDDDWSDAPFREERNLVFLKAKAAAEPMAVHAGRTLVPRYLKSPTEPDFSHALTPTRSLLFRYSALTFNAHLLHLDPSYARDVEGHRNLLVHGSLTLTLMLQTLAKHLRVARIGTKFKRDDSRMAMRLERVDSVEYRNLAPLYCDEEMRVCVKNKKRTDTGNTWDVWIEGPTGGMAVKAVVRTVDGGRTAPPTDRTADDMTSTDLPDAQTVALQAQDKLNTLDRKDPGTEQLFQMSQAKRRKLRRADKRQLKRTERMKRAARSLPYLYSASSPLVVRVSQPSSHVQQPSASPPSSTTPLSQQAPPVSREREQYSNMWRKRWVGKSLPYLYLWQTSALYNRAVVPRSAQARAPGIRAAPKPEVPHARPLIRKLRSQSFENVSQLKSMQKPTGSGDKAVAVRNSAVRPRQLRIRKVEQVSIREVDFGLQKAARKRAHTRMEKAKKGVKADVLRAEKAREENVGEEKAGAE